MKANELRIMNLVNYPNWNNDGKDYFFYVRDLYFEKDKIGLTTLKYQVKTDFENIKPIPLTEDWLLKFGFKKYDGWDDMIFWFKEKDENNMCRFALIETEQGYEIETTEKICKFVHELQNCYYFHELTGEELIINENL